MKKVFYTISLLLITFSLFAQRDDSNLLKIVGGEPAAEQEFPWMASITLGGGFPFPGCGASLIAPQWVLTAAHCDIGFIDLEAVIINSLHLDEATFEPHSEKIAIEQIFVHEDWSMQGGGPDIALIRLSEPSITEPIALAEWPDSLLWSHGSTGKTAGWGTIDEAGNNSDSLLFADVSFFDSQTCDDLTQFFNNNPTGSICAGFFPGEAVGGAASGDSGGPLFYMDNNGEYRQVGIVSGGDGQTTVEDGPGVFTLVPEYRPWIDSIMTAFDMPVSVNFVKEESLNISYFANDIVRVENLELSDNYTFSLYDIVGKNATPAQFVSGRSNHDFSVKDQQPGIYIMTIRNHSQGFVTSEKIFIH